MPSFDIMSEVDQPSLRNAVEQANRKIEGRHDFKGTSAKIEHAEKLLTLYGDSDFQLVETLAERCAALLITEFGATGVRLKLAKPGAFEGADTVGVVIERGHFA